MGKKFTEKDTKMYLLSLQDFHKGNHERLMQIMELRAVAENCTVRTDKESIQSSGSGDKMANLIGKIVDLEREIYRFDKILMQRRAEFEEIAKMMKDERQREFLTTRYFDGNSFFDTIMIMDLKDSTAKRIHRHAITEFTNLYNSRHNI